MGERIKANKPRTGIMHIEDPFGNEKEYDPEKIIDSVKRAGFGRDAAEKIEKKVRERVEDGIRSRKLYRIVYEEMKKVDDAYALRYRLREAIGALDPQYHEFEKYMTRVLRHEGIDTEWSPRPLPQGLCSEHEVDIVGKTDGITYTIECKHHFHYHRLTGLDVPMIQRSVLEDLQEGYDAGMENAIDVDTSWVIVNTKLSHHAKKYAECKGIKMTAWDHPEENSLRQIVERHKAYPITILRLSKEEKKRFSQQDILTLQELLDLGEPEKTDLGLPNNEITQLQEKAQQLLTE